MKKMCYSKIIVFLFLSLIIGCETATENQQENDLYGTWQLKIISGGFAGISDTLNIFEEKRVVSFHEDNSFSYFYNDSLTLEGKYLVKQDEVIFSSEKQDVIVYYDYNSDINVENDAVYYLSTDTLVLADNYVDGFVRLYTRY